MYDIVFLVRNEFETDPRVNKTVRSVASRFPGKNLLVDSFVNVLDSEKVDIRSSDYTVIRYISGVAKARAVMKAQDNIVPTSKKIDRTSLAFFYIVYLNCKFFLQTMWQRSKIYYVNDLDTLLCGYLLSVRYGGKLVYDAHELFSELYSDYTPMLKWLYSWMERFLIRRCDYVVTVNESIAEELKDRYSIEKPTVVMNCPVYRDSDDMTHPTERDSRTIIYIGSYQEERRLEDMVTSIAYTDDIVLHLRGWGSLEPMLHKIVDELQLQDRVLFLEPVPMDQIVSSLKPYKFGIIPYIACNLNNKYSTPNKLFEYMHAGVIPIYPEYELVEIDRIMKGVGIDSSVKMANPVLFGKEVQQFVMRYDDVKKSMETHQKLIKVSNEMYNWDIQIKPTLDFIYNNL